MNFKEKRYFTGEAIHSGDKIVFASVPGVVVFVNDTKEYLPGFTPEGWQHEGSGFMIQQPNGALIFLTEADEDLKFVARA
jgi:hypothetical protein